MQNLKHAMISSPGISPGFNLQADGNKDRGWRDYLAFWGSKWQMFNVGRMGLTG
jgi:hypothetical protein